MPPFLPLSPLLCISLPQSPHVPGRTGLMGNIFMTRCCRALQNSPPHPQIRTLPVMTGPYPGAGVIISWGPGGFPRVMTMTTTSPEALHNDQPGHTLPGTIDNSASLSPCPNLPHLKLKLTSAPQRWVEVFTLRLPPSACAPFSALHHHTLLFVWCVGVSSQL